MSADPLLVLQLQRMGDLILTFPLLLALKKRWPGHPLWVAAEPQFFQELMPLAPEVVFFPPSHCSTLARGTYAAVINLSGRPEAAACLAGATAGLKLGPAALPDGLHVHGYWQLYRAALTQNNRHNAFHWSDLYRLDLDPTIRPGQTGHILPKSAGSGRVGLVLGASEAAKHPDALFWARLARRLTTAGIMPLFLGGKAEQALGEEVARLARLPQANLCGRLPLREVAAVLRGLDLCITPDTGPMHLADWLGVPVLNLSMGPVHARETGPIAPGQWVLRAAMSCVGCWQCRRSKLYCKLAFTPAAVARAALAILENPRDVRLLSRTGPLSGLSLYRTGRDALGLYRLEASEDREGRSAAISCRFLLEDFWQAAFLFLYDPSLRPLARQRLATLRSAFPPLVQRLGAGLTRLCTHCAAAFKHHSESLSADFWRAEAPLLRLFAGHTHMFLQNADFSAQGWQTAIERLTALCDLFASETE
ncbi:MAG: glycosyltransferase family 9 protein [Desulfovibrio sp.]|uniref:glycosyltransferase family 9 protein n=1 Tax=Desulfovibrio sp. TaxID=885 RepID=UPI002583A094|nr:glycosyltransferase family 9 protein [Desulfovibrio sp.]MCD7984108.1 glycosyltransferase family 9 protein [Desulfovibrio sp.]